MKEKVLIVDDEDTLRLSLRSRLQQHGFATDVASDGAEALEKMKRNEYDVVLLDVNMPRLSGLEALPMIKDLYPRTDVVMLTGFADFSTAIDCLKAGAKDYLVKPIETTELVSRLQSLLRAKSLEKTLIDYQREQMATLINDVLGPLNLVGSILSHVLTRDGMSNPEDEKTLLRYAQSFCGRIADRVTHLVNKAQVELGDLDLQKTEVNIETLVSNVVAAFQSRASEKRIKLQTSIGEALPTLSCDKDKLSQAFSNVLENSIAQAPTKAIVKIGASMHSEQDHKSVIFTVSLDVSGIQAQEYMNIYVREIEEALRGNNYKGDVAIGLAKARKILEAHGGALNLESIEGSGIGYQFILPVTSPVDAE